MKLSKPLSAFIYALLLLGVLMIALPIYMTVMTAFKTAAENTASFFALPQALNFENFKKVLEGGRYWQAFGNTVFITVVALLGNALVFPPMSYALSRSIGYSRAYRFLYMYLLVGIFIPFQVKMIPLVKLMSWLNFMNPMGLSILYIASSTCESVFLYVGFLQSIPPDIEDSAYIDGASTAQTFYRIIFPLMRPMIATALIKDGLWIWNDFMLPLITLNRSWKYWTLTLFQYNFKTEYSIDYSLTFASFCLSMLPIVVFYVFMQKNIIGGLTSGAIKG